MRGFQRVICGLRTAGNEGKQDMMNDFALLSVIALKRINSLFLSAFLIPLLLLSAMAIFTPVLAENVAEGITLQETRYQHKRYVVVTLSLDKVELQHHWKNNDTGLSYSSLAGLNSATRKKGDELLFAINSGIYTKEYTPLGLYIENHQTYSPLNLVKSNGGQGNFSLFPNGIFYMTDDNRAHVLDTDAFHRQFKRDYANIRDAVQSGPMLLVNGEYNPYFIPKSDSLRIRSAVCAMDEGRKATFVVTEDSVNFYEFASFFRDELQCDKGNALYLDGTLARIYLKGRVYGASFWQAKPMVGIWSVIREH